MAKEQIEIRYKGTLGAVAKNMDGVWDIDAASAHAATKSVHAGRAAMYVRSGHFEYTTAPKKAAKPKNKAAPRKKKAAAKKEEPEAAPKTNAPWTSPGL